MFWLAAAIYVSLDSILPVPFWLDGPVRLRNIGLTVLFFHGWSPGAINAIVPGGWSIAVEMNFYLIFPVIVPYARTVPRSLCIVALAIVIAVLSNTLGAHVWGTAIPKRELNEFLYFWLPNSLPSFALGLLAFNLLDWGPRSHFDAAVLLVCAGLIGLYVAWGPLPYSASLGHPISRGTLFSFGCVLLTLALHRVPYVVLVNRATRALGQVSFSGYLLHWLLVESLLMTVGRIHANPIVSILLYPVTLFALILVTTCLASVTYACVEQPCIRAGALLARRLSRLPRVTSVVP